MRRLAALHQAPDREGLLALGQQQGLGGVEHAATHQLALLVTALCDGGGSHGGGLGGARERRETYLTVL